MSVYEDIYGNIEEFQEVDKEIKRLNKKLKELRLKKKESEEKICEFLKEKNQPGFKYKNIAITMTDKLYRSRKNIAEKKEQMLEIIRNSKDPESNEVVEEILESIKGETYTKKYIKIQRIKNI
jgi:lipopolysaccharide biosynthesis regulator YciM